MIFDELIGELLTAGANMKEINTVSDLLITLPNLCVGVIITLRII